MSAPGPWRARELLDPDALLGLDLDDVLLGWEEESPPTKERKGPSQRQISARWWKLFCHQWGQIGKSFRNETRAEKWRHRCEPAPLPVRITFKSHIDMARLSNLLAVMPDRTRFILVGLGSSRMKSPLVRLRAEVSKGFVDDDAFNIVVQVMASKGSHPNAPSRVLVESTLADLLPRAPPVSRFPFDVFQAINESGLDLDIRVEQDEFVWVRVLILRDAAIRARGAIGITIESERIMWILDGLQTRDIS